MHHHCEIIMPRTKDIGGSLATILKPFDENTEDQSGSEFWDFYVVGGRFAGTKETCGYAQEKMDEFDKALTEKKITVSGIQCGKQTLEPASQIPMVDEIWNEFFPTENGEIVPCPLFSHSNNQYDSSDLISCDICLVEEIPEKLKASRVIFAGPRYDSDELEATFMICDTQWNGVNHMPINWDGKVKSAIEMMEKNSKGYTDKYQERFLPKPNWICVTIDYHS